MPAAQVPANIAHRPALSALIDPAVAGGGHASVHEDSSIHKPNSIKAETMMKHMILWPYALPGYVRFCIVPNKLRQCRNSWA